MLGVFGGSGFLLPSEREPLRNASCLPSGDQYGSEAPSGSSVTDAGMPVTVQCQKPEPVGASGS